MANMNNVIQKHNSKIMKIQHHLPPKLASAIEKHCPVDGNCLSECLIYKVFVSKTTNKYYYGTCEHTLKERYNNHECYFRNKSREKTH